MSKYNEIINMPHHVSSVHKPMPMMNRAAQFAPFAALTGHDAAIIETARLTSEKIELSADEAAALSKRLEYVLSFEESPEITITYFVKDKLKAGGSYQQITGIIRKLEEYDSTIILTNGKSIRLTDILSINGDIFWYNF